MIIKSKYSFTKLDNVESLDQTYVCANDGTELYVLGHVDIDKADVAELSGKAGAYAWLVQSDDPKVGMESIHNGTFSSKV